MKKTISILLLIALVISCVSVGYADNEFKQYSLIGRSAMPWTSDEIFSSPEYRAYLTLMSTYSIGISTDMDNMMYIMDNLEYLWDTNPSYVAKDGDTLVVIAFSPNRILEIRYEDPTEYHADYRFTETDLSGEELEKYVASMAEQYEEYYLNTAEAIESAKELLSKTMNK